MRIKRMFWFDGNWYLLVELEGATVVVCFHYYECFCVQEYWMADMAPKKVNNDEVMCNVCDSPSDHPG